MWTFKLCHNYLSALVTELSQPPPAPWPATSATRIARRVVATMMPLLLVANVFLILEISTEVISWLRLEIIFGPTLRGERTTLSQVVLNTEMLKVNTDVPSGLLMLMTPTLTILKLHSYNAESVVISHSRTSTNHMFNMWYQLLFQPELLVFQTIFNSMPLSIPG